jgi:hypothetical protein
LKSSSILHIDGLFSAVDVATKKRVAGSIKRELITKSREAALNAIRVFNDPHVSFKSETFVVLMVIAWTYFLHAYFRSKGVECRYFRQGPKRRIFDRTKHGAYKHWELERCLNDSQSPLDKDTTNNLRFLIGLRNEIEHQMTRSLDGYLSGRYQACALNYNRYLKKLFGAKLALDKQLTYSIQFVELLGEQIGAAEPDVPGRLKGFIAEFDGKLTHEEYNDPRFAYRLLFKKKLVNRPGQADRVIEFIDPNSDLAKQIDREYWVKKETEKPKFRAKDVVDAVRKAGFSKFKIQPHHLDMWRAADGKNPSNGFGIDVQGTWYWYQNWIDRCVRLCQDADDAYR